MLKKPFPLFNRAYNIYCLFLLLCSFGFTQAQMISAGLNESKNFNISFNPAFIRDTKISSLTKHITNKPDNQVIVDKGIIEHYEFNSKGLLSSMYTTEVKSTSERDIPSYTFGRHGKRIPYTKIEYSYLYDTTFVFYEYDELNRLIIKRTSIIGREVFRSHYYEYDEKNNIKKETVIREVNVAENLADIKIGMQTVLSVESFAYESLAPTQLKKKFLNDEGRVYKEGIIYSDSCGNVIEEAFDFTVTWLKEHNYYKYNDKHLLIEKKIGGNDGSSSLENYDYELDDAGTLNELRIFKDGIKTNNISYLYDKTTKIVDSEVNRDFKNLSIGIIKYNYTYYSY